METKFNYEKILLFSVRMGEIMLKSGAETYRVEDTITRVLSSHGFKYVDTFVTPTVIMATIKEQEQPICSALRRIKNRSTRLDKIEQINQLSRDYVYGALSIKEAETLLEQIEDTPPYPSWLIHIATGLAAGFFCLMFEGKVIDFVISFILGVSMAKIQQILRKKQIINYFTLFISAFFVGTSIVILTALMPATIQSEAVIIGGIMPLVPGLAFTNAIRDTIGDELLSGISRGVEALFIAVAIAAGVGIPMSIGIFLGGIGL